MPLGTGPLRIGAFAREVGVSPDLLRAWERRYGLLQPVRSPGGFRLYTAADAERVRRMQRALAGGLSAAEAAHAALAAGAPAPDAIPGSLAAQLFEAVCGFDEAASHRILDESLDALGLEATLQRVVLPALAHIGDEWQAGRVGVDQEHFASNLLRGRLLALTRLWAHGSGRLAVLACPPDESHDIGLLAFGLLLRARGWRIVFLGADTPVETIAATASRTRPSLVVVASVSRARLERQRASLAALARTARLALSGPGADDDFAGAIGAQRLGPDLLQALTDLATREEVVRDEPLAPSAIAP